MKRWSLSRVLASCALLTVLGASLTNARAQSIKHADVESIRERAGKASQVRDASAASGELYRLAQEATGRVEEHELRSMHEAIVGRDHHFWAPLARAELGLLCLARGDARAAAEQFALGVARLDRVSTVEDATCDVTKMLIRMEADAIERAGDVRDAIAKERSLLAHPRVRLDDSERAGTYRVVARRLVKSGSVQEGLDSFDQAIRILRESGDSQRGAGVILRERLGVVQQHSSILDAQAARRSALASEWVGAYPQWLHIANDVSAYASMHSEPAASRLSEARAMVAKAEGLWARWPEQARSEMWEEYIHLRLQLVRNKLLCQDMSGVQELLLQLERDDADARSMGTYRDGIRDAHQDFNESLARLGAMSAAPRAPIEEPRR
jgi:tetratricopeptide (TPR) repeat protein